VKRLRSLLALGVVLALTALVVPDSSIRVPSLALVRTDTVQGVDHSRDVIWILCLGSDARPGEMPLRTRADAIQMVGVNLRTGTGTVIGVPRDSWVDIPGHGYNRINAALYYGGPQLMGRTVGNLVGVQPDYVFVTTFTGFRNMIQAVGGVTVHSRLAFTDDNMPGNIHRGVNHLDGAESLFFSRARHFLPRGDFDRSANQQEMLRAILRQVRSREHRPGFMERSVLSVTKNLYTNLSPGELYTLAQSLTVVDPSRFRGCVVNGSIGDVNGASIVFPDRGQAQRLGDDARNDARLDRGC
jgi:LCP family protein required for cell wall assembly